MGYAWIITQDHLSDRETSQVGTTGPEAASDADIARLQNGEGFAFRMYGGDDELCYTGRLVVSGKTDRGDESAVFGPLDDFGQPDTGCTEIRWAYDNWKSA